MKSYIGGQRPAIPSSAGSDVSRIVDQCWAQDPERRPTFAAINQELQRTGVSKFVDSAFIAESRLEAWDLNRHELSPDIKPMTPLPQGMILLNGS
jgi:hypothetical protein